MPPLDLSDTLVVGISATALFDLAEADAIYKARSIKNPQSALEEYRAYMLERENEPLRDGTGSYAPGFAALVTLAAIGAIAVSMLPDRPRPARESAVAEVRSSNYEIQSGI